MKLSTSFVTPVARVVIPMVAGLWAAALAMVIVAVLLVQQAWTMRQQVPEMRDRLAQIDVRMDELKAKDSGPSIVELEGIKQRVMAINALTGIRGWPAPIMLAQLEQMLPDSVYLVSLNHKLKDGEVHLLAESRDAVALTGFLKRLEKEPHFSEVMLVRQAQRDSQGNHAIQFQVRLKERQ